MPSTGPPLAYFLTWTTYGTWLHGDRRGSVDDAHNVFGHPVLEARPDRAARIREGLAEQPFVMTARVREVVDDAIRAHAEIRSWRVLGLNVRTNHVHLVIEASSHSPEQVMAQCKSWATRRLQLEQRERRALIKDCIKVPSCNMHFAYCFILLHFFS